MKEKDYINIIKQTLLSSAGYIGDDTAYISEKDLILTQDTMIEDIHFRQTTTTPYYLGRKAMAVNLSDIAAAGGVPEFALVSLSMPKQIPEGFCKEFYEGINSICEEYKMLVVGGDLTSAEKVTISICVIGSGKGLTPANRRNAKPGDAVVIVGEFGLSRAGLEILEKHLKVSDEIGEKLIQAHINPVPLVKEGRKILERSGAPAMMDASDGLADALWQICEMSGVEMEINFDEIPYDKNINIIAKDEKTLREWVLFGGEDYGLMATVAPEVYGELRQEIAVKKIGTVKPLSNEPFAIIKFSGGEKLKLNSEIFEKSTGYFRHF